MTGYPLEIEGLKKSYGYVSAVNGVDLTLGERELLTLVGPSGCGKSTLLRTVAGLVAADEGSIRLGGELVDDGSVQLPPERRSAGLVFQEHALFPHLTVRDNVGFGVRSLPRREVAVTVEEMLDLVSLAGYGDRYPHELSGGERQRVALARALAPAPSLMLLDEPFASLDHNLRVQLRHDVAEALRATDTPAVFVTHDQEEALAVGDRIAVMRRGRIVQLSSPEVVFHTPADTFVGAFMGEASFLPVTNVGGVATSALGPVDGEVGEDRVAMVRPHDVAVRSTADGRGEIVATEYQGGHWLSRVQLPEGTVTVESSHLEHPRVGDRCEVGLRPGHEQVLVPLTAD